MLFGSECPVCADDSLICLRSKQSAALVFYCPICGTAFHDLPPPRTVDDILSLRDVAPAGVELPTSEEIAASGLRLGVLSDEWLEDLTTRDPRTPDEPPVFDGVQPYVWRHNG